MQHFFSRKVIGRTVVLGAAMALLGSAVILGLLARDQSGSAQQTSQGIPSASTTSTIAASDRALLDGMPRTMATATRPVAVMVENHVDARPLSGIAAASLVFEAPVEGGITRLLAFFDTTRVVPEIGPVRSARPYYIDWASEFEALYVHVGGSPEALAKVASTGIHDLNQFFADKYFWRSSARSAPHNVYTSTALLGKALEARQIQEPPTVASWQFADADPATTATTTNEIRIPFSSPSYAVRWRWDPVGARYLRFVGGAPASDRDGKRQVAANVVVISTDTAVLDDVGRLRLDSLGSGDGTLFRDGFAEAITWKKKTAGTRLKFFSKQTGEEVFFRPGTTWIEVVPEEVEVTSDATVK